MDKLIQNYEYKSIDQNLTAENFGFRKQKKVGDNLFVIIAIVNSANHNNKGATDIDGIYCRLCTCVINRPGVTGAVL